MRAGIGENRRGLVPCTPERLPARGWGGGDVWCELTAPPAVVAAARRCWRAGLVRGRPVAGSRYGGLGA